MDAKELLKAWPLMDRQERGDLEHSETILRALSLLASVEGSSDEVVRGLAGFTPGPWEWLGENSLWGGERGKSGALEEIFSASDDGKDYGMHSAIISHHWDKNVAEANRKLIAAAPQLLAHIIALQAELARVKAHAEAMATKHEEIRTASVREIDRMEAQLHEAVDAYRAAHPKEGT